MKEKEQFTNSLKLFEGREFNFSSFIFTGTVIFYWVIIFPNKLY